MKKYIFLFLLFLFFGLFSHIATASNSHSIDLESNSSQFLSAPDSNSLSITGDMTIEGWVKLESNTDGQILVSKWDGTSGNREYIVRLNPDTGNVILYNHDNTNVGVASVNYAFPPTGTWFHVAVTLDISPTPTIELFINGVGQATSTGSLVSSTYDGGSTFRIGAQETDTQAFLDGSVDDVRVWNIVRTPVEIADDYSKELFGNETGLVGYWKFNNSFSDITSNGNNLTNHNNAIFSTETPFGSFTELLKVRKSVNESVVSSTVLQNDNELRLSLDNDKTYIIDGVIFASSTSATPDIKIGFFAPTESVVKIGYTNDVNEAILASGISSSAIALPANMPTSIHLKGTIKTSSTNGDFQLKWSQANSNTAATTVMEGSYLRAEAI